MKEAVEIISSVNQELAFPEDPIDSGTRVALTVEEWERVCKYIQYLQEVEAYHDKVMEVVSDMPIDIDDIIEA